MTQQQAQPETAHVVIDDVHLSGHTVERGFVKTASMPLGRNCTIGVVLARGLGLVVSLVLA